MTEAREIVARAYAMLRWEHDAAIGGDFRTAPEYAERVWSTHTEEADSILTALREAGLAIEEGWKPIETAPKDGTRVLLWLPNRGQAQIGSFRVDGGFSGSSKPLWLDESYSDFATGYESNPLTPTFWKPLASQPAPPAPDQGSGE